MNYIIFSPFNLYAKHGGAKILSTQSYIKSSKLISTENYIEFRILQKILLSKYFTFLPFAFISFILFFAAIRPLFYLIILYIFTKKKVFIIVQPELSLIHIFISFLGIIDTCIIHDCPIHFINSYPLAFSYPEYYLKRILNQSKNAKVVSPGMINQYKLISNKKINYEIELGKLSKDIINLNFVRRQSFINSKKRVIMAGSGHLGGRVKLSNDDLIPILDQFGKLKKYEFIVTDLRYSKICNYSNIKYTGWLNQNELKELFDSNCIGFSYDLINPKQAKFAYLSFPTKIQYYLCLATPFLYFGPKESSVNTMLSKFNCGEIINSYAKKTEIETALENIFENYSYYSNNAKVAAIDLFGK